jgi:pimeloyl-ACP methyl ester carboxylesterase
MAIPDPAPGRVIELPGRGETFVRERGGPPGAPTVLLLHGLAATALLNWFPAFGPLSRHFRVVALDHRGHGRGIHTSERFRLADCADDAVALADVLGIERFVAVGYSMGGPIASLLAHRHAERVAGIVLCATARNFTGRGPQRRARVLAPVLSVASRAVPGAMWRASLRAMMIGRIQNAELRAVIDADLRGTQPRAVLEAAGSLGRYSSQEWIGQLGLPAAVIVMERDELVAPERQHKLAASIPGATVHLVDGDHSACVARADLFVPALIDACQSVLARPAAEIPQDAARTPPPSS